MNSAGNDLKGVEFDIAFSPCYSSKRDQFLNKNLFTVHVFTRKSSELSDSPLGVKSTQPMNFSVSYRRKNKLILSLTQKKFNLLLS